MDGDVSRGVVPATLSKLGLRDFFFPAEILLDLKLDGKPVAVPARHVWRPHAGHGLELHDEILENLVQRMSDVDIPVGIRRAVVENEGGTFLPSRLQLLVKTDLHPASENLGLPLGQIRPHREVGLRKVQRVLVVNGCRGMFGRIRHGPGVIPTGGRQFNFESLSRPSQLWQGKTPWRSA